jgi:thiamine-phosphate diphosphorylase
VPFPDLRLCLLFTPELCAQDPWDTLRAALRGGVDLVQWRSKQPDDAAFRRCRDLCAAREAPLVVNDDVMLAVRGRAHGVHLGQEDAPPEVARRLVGDAWVGVSTHDLEQIAAAARAGADYVGFGPCHPTATKGYEQGLPPALVEEAARTCPLPLFAIGGITVENLPALQQLGVQRIAVSRAVLQAPDPAAAAAALRERLWAVPSR